MAYKHTKGFRQAKRRLVSLFDGVKDVAVYASSRLIFYTPVKTGYLRGGWSVGFDALPGNTFRFDKKGAATLRSIKALMINLKPGQTINVANHVEYGPFVDQGTSRMAPRNIVKRAESDLKLKMKEIIVKRWQRPLKTL